MKIDGTQVLKNLDGQEMVSLISGTGKDGREEITRKPTVLREIITNLLNMETNENRLTSEKKSKAWQIMKKLWDSKEVDLTVDERAFILERAMIFYPPMTYGVISEVLEEKK